MCCGEGGEDLYEGTIQKGERNGMGKLTRSSGIVEEGLWENGVLSKAVYRYANGDLYEGTVQDGKPDGKG